MAREGIEVTPEFDRIELGVMSTNGHDIVDRGIAQWRHERPDIDCSAKGVVGRILRLQEVILRAVNDALAPHGLSYSSYAVLATLRASGTPFAMSPSDLVQTLLLSSGGISNLLARLEKQGWIKRVADPQDGRGVIVQLSAKGRRLADRAMADHARVEQDLVSMMPAAERGSLAGSLRKMLLAAKPDDRRPTSKVQAGPHTDA